MGGENGIVVFEADHVVAHVVYGAYPGTHGDRGPLALPDIDGSGHSPILIMSGGTHLGLLGSQFLLGGSHPSLMVGP
jgi:hypothetical protein